ncbi:ParB/RepB/Spo0J family partition protein [Haloglycomyces albus]|uniref:ParB/RepB/Spo0J family partition protein n=1 Tax=Haloglycomyces albus TaxID=526067 RepID=UPI00046D321A|nr:ParB/RepB/Spo0J family partition protein [Haloglycomyces albus]
MAATKRGGLGRGLGALIPTGVADVSGSEESTEDAEPIEKAEGATPAQRESETMEAGGSDVSRETSETEAELHRVPGADFQLVSVDAVVANTKQPRQIFDEDSLEELQVSLREVGMLQPVAVRLTSDGVYELVMGERRLRAAKALGWKEIPAIVRQTADDEMLREALLENIHRVELNPLEEGAAYQQLLEEFGVTQEELASRIGRSRPQISNMIRLLSLPGRVQTKVAAGVITAGHARALLSLEDDSSQEHIAERIISEGLTVRSTEELVTACKLEETPEADDGKPEAKAPKKADKIKAPGLEELRERLSDHFETSVKVTWGQKKGKIVIDFASVADLDRIVEQMKLDQ